MAKKVHKLPHRYRRFKLGKKEDYIIFKCILPACTHYLHESVMIGQQFLCECGKVGTVTEAKDLKVVDFLKCKDCQINADIPPAEVMKVLEKVKEG